MGDTLSEAKCRNKVLVEAGDTLGSIASEQSQACQDTAISREMLVAYNPHLTHGNNRSSDGSKVVVGDVVYIPSREDRGIKRYYVDQIESAIDEINRGMYVEKSKLVTGIWYGLADYKGKMRDLMILCNDAMPRICYSSAYTPGGYNSIISFDGFCYSDPSKTHERYQHGDKPASFGSQMPDVSLFLFGGDSSSIIDQYYKKACKVDD